MPQSKVKPLVTAWIGLKKKPNVFFYCFFCGEKNRNDFSDFQVLPTEV